MRQCGNCRACCTVLGVPSLKKPRYQACEHECDKGCAIYKERPDECKAYYCAWANNEEAGDPIGLKGEERPDKVGLFFDATLHKTFGLLIVAHEVTEGLSKTYWGEKVLKRLSKRFLVAIVFGDQQRSMVGPPHLLRTAGEQMRQYALTGRFQE